MKQLSGVESYLLHTERGNIYNHAASLGIYDPSTAPGGKVRFKAILEHFARRTEANPVFRRRLVNVPHGVDRPYWIDSPDLDLEFHVRHIALPHPGDWRQLMIQVARIHSRPLDRSRPLWEAYVIEGLDRIEGLPKGSFAIFMKAHLASIDGQATAQLLRSVHSLTPDTEALGDEGKIIYTERDPATLELYSRALWHGAKRLLGAARLNADAAGIAARSAFAELQRRLGRSPAPNPALALSPRVPMTRFNLAVSANRVVNAILLPLDRFEQALRAVPDAKADELFLAVVGGALRRYLSEQHELPDKPMAAFMSSTGREARRHQSLVAELLSQPISLHTDIENPLDRLAAIRADVNARASGTTKVARELVGRALEDLPHGAAEAILRNLIYPQANVAMTRLRGPDTTLYLAGAQLVSYYPVPIAMDHVGLAHTGFVYNGTMGITFAACRNMLPNPEHYGECLRASFDELSAALAPRPRMPKPPSSERPRPSPRKAKPPRTARKSRSARRPGPTQEAATA